MSGGKTSLPGRTGEGRSGHGPKEALLARVREALSHRPRTAHPGIPPPRAVTPEGGVTVTRFEDALSVAGGEVHRFADEAAAMAWLRAFEVEFATAAQSGRIPEPLRMRRPESEPAEAGVGVSFAVGAGADTGSIVLSSAEGRRLQLLPPTLLVWIAVDRIHPTLQQALASARSSEPSALALHSGPSKSADIGRVLVTGVHGPGRLVAGILG